MKISKFFLIIELVALIITLFTFSKDNFFIHLLLNLVFTNLIGTSIAILFFTFSKIKYVRILPKFLKYIGSIFLTIVGTLIGTFLSILILNNVPGLNIGFKFDLNLFSKTILIISSVVTIYFVTFIVLKKQLEMKIEENKKLKELHLETQLKALQVRLNPHFLFNTLNTLLGLIKTNSELAEEVIIKMSKMYRKILELPEVSLIPLSEEIEIIKDYLSIEKLRMGERLNFNISVEEKLNTMKIPPLLIEPLIENSIKHGIDSKKEGGKIVLNIFSKNEYTIIEVKDNGIGTDIDETNFNFGLNSVRERVKMLNKKNKFTFNSKTNKGTEILMELKNEN